MYITHKEISENACEYLKNVLIYKPTQVKHFN